MFSIFKLIDFFKNILNHIHSTTLILFISLVLCNGFLAILIFLLIHITRDLNKANKNLKNGKKLYDNLSNSYDSIRGFKHDFSNIMQSIGGYLSTNDLKGLKVYYSSVFDECKTLNNASVLNSDVLNSPPVLSLVTEKYYKAKDLGIDFNIEVFTDLTKINIDIYEFTRMLGIFLDNSIEAASKSSKKLINIIIMKDVNNNCDLLIIENSYFDKSIDTVKIFNKDFSTKPKNTGIGLWRVKKIIEKHNNLILNTSVSDNLFRHQLRIYH